MLVMQNDSVTDIKNVWALLYRYLLLQLCSLLAACVIVAYCHIQQFIHAKLLLTQGRMTLISMSPLVWVYAVI